MLSDQDVRELERAAAKAAAPVARAAVRRAMQESGGGTEEPEEPEEPDEAEEEEAEDSPEEAGGQQGAATAAAPVKAFIEPEHGDNIACLFNPAELTIAKSNQWAEVKAPGRNTPKLTFAQGQPGTISMELTLDTTDSGKP